MRHLYELPIVPLVLALATSVFAQSPGRNYTTPRQSFRGGAPNMPARVNVPPSPASVPPSVRGPAASATAVQDELPASMPGTWTVHLCIAGEESWIRLEHTQSGEFHTLSRSGQNPIGVQWDLDVQRERDLTSLDHIRASATVQNPRIFRGSNKGRQYGVSQHNCAGFTRDAWYFYSGEWYPIPSPPTAAALRELVLRQHPDQPAKVFTVPEQSGRTTPREQSGRTPPRVQSGRTPLPTNRRR